MKKSIIIALATAGFAMGALAQGSIGGLNNVNQYVTTGVGNYNLTVASSNSYYSGAISMEVFFSSAATSGQANAINALNGTAGGGAAALALLGTDGFTQVGLTGQSYGSSVGAVTGTTTGPNALQLNGLPATVYLSNAFAANTAGYLALYFFEGTYATAEVITGSQTYGGQVGGTGGPFAVTGPMNAFDPSGSQNGNLDMTAPVSSPEPSSLALAGLGGFGMLMAFRRKKA